LIIDKILLEQGYLVADFPLPESIQTFVIEKNWKALDDYFLEISRPNNQLNIFLSQYLKFNFLEHIIAIRSAPDDDEGIWHDDGSRFLGFSLSLNIAPQSIEGGVLRFKKKNSDSMESFSQLPYGKIVIFLTGVYGYEHMVSAVTKGQRIVIAGWCSQV
jgi:predicted 2-oxoglutarate/Fe(II)-dependent dioxygenase YbiX